MIADECLALAAGELSFAPRRDTRRIRRSSPERPYLRAHSVHCSRSLHLSARAARSIATFLPRIPRGCVLVFRIAEHSETARRTKLLRGSMPQRGRPSTSFSYFYCYHLSPFCFPFFVPVPRASQSVGRKVHDIGPELSSPRFIAASIHRRATFHRYCSVK